MTLKTVLTVLAAAGALAVGTSAPAAPAARDAAKPQRQCFWANQINGFAASDSQTVNLRVGVKDVYQLELFANCPDVNWTQTIAVRARGSSHICSGLDAEVISPSTLGPQRCAVRTVRKLSDAEIAALPKQGRP